MNCNVYIDINCKNITKIEWEQDYLLNVNRGKIEINFPIPYWKLLFSTKG